MRYQGSLNEEKDKDGSAKVIYKSGNEKKVTVTTNNRIQAGFNSARRNQLINYSDAQSEKILASLEMFKTFYSTSD